MKFASIFFFTFYCYGLTFGQTNTDSLWQIWNGQDYSLTERLGSLETICKKQYLYTKPDSAFALAKIGYEFAENKDLKNEMAENLRIMGIARSQMSDYEEAIGYLNSSIKISKELKNEVATAQYLNSLGNVYLRKSDYNLAIENYRQSLDIAENRGDEMQIATNQNNMGLVYFDLKEYKKSLKLLQSALDFYEKNDLEDKAANTLQNIGTIYRKQKKYAQALVFCEQSLRIKLKNKSAQGLAICYSNIGMIYSETGENEKALAYLNRSYELNIQAENQKGIERDWINFAKNYQKIKVDTAIFLAERAWSHAVENDNLEEILDASELLHILYDETGQHEKALDSYKMFHLLQDSMQSIFNQKALWVYEYKLKENRRKIVQKRCLSLIFGGVILFLLIGGFYIKSRYEKVLLRSEKLQEEVMNLAAKLKKQEELTPPQSQVQTLDKDKIEAALGSKIGASSWMILTLISENPSISNKEIAAKVSLSVEGVSSSLRRMYTAFNIKSTGNKKITLLMKAYSLSEKS